MVRQIAENKFIRTLAGDVDTSLSRMRIDDTESNRRDSVRTLFCAIEGMAWICREHIKFAAENLEIMTPILEMALNEQTYFVTEGGRVRRQIRYISFTAMFKLISEVAHQIRQDYHVDFSSGGWSNVIISISVRNRVMHPKCVDDLLVSDEDLNKIVSAFNWIFDTCLEMMAAVNDELVIFNKTAREFIDGLMSGDEAVLAEYKAALESA